MTRQSISVAAVFLVIITVLSSSVFSFCSGENLFTSDPFPDPAIFDDDCPIYTTDTITVSDLPGSISKVTVRLTIYHTWVADLDVYLEHPSGVQVELATDNGGFADAHYIDTVFDDDAATSINDGTAPYTGTFRPETPLSVLMGLEAVGDWRLLMCDDNAEDVGYFDRWDLCIQMETGATPTPTCINHGDVNDDNMVTAADAQMAFYILMGTITPTQQQFCAADCDGTGAVTAGDSQLIFMASLGMGDGCVDELPSMVPDL